MFTIIKNKSTFMSEGATNEGEVNGYYDDYHTRFTPQFVDCFTINGSTIYQFKVTCFFCNQIEMKGVVDVLEGRFHICVRCCNDPELSFKYCECDIPHAVCPGHCLIANIRRMLFNLTYGIRL